MTIAVRITNEDPPLDYPGADPKPRRTLLVTTLAYEKGKHGTRPVVQQHIQPGQSAVFHVHPLQDIHVEELAE